MIMHFPSEKSDIPERGLCLNEILEQLGDKKAVTHICERGFEHVGPNSHRCSCGNRWRHWEDQTTLYVCTTKSGSYHHLTEDYEKTLCNVNVVRIVGMQNESLDILWAPHWDTDSLCFNCRMKVVPT